MLLHSKPAAHLCVWLRVDSVQLYLTQRADLHFYSHHNFLLPSQHWKRDLPRAMEVIKFDLALTYMFSHIAGRKTYKRHQVIVEDRLNPMK